MHTEKLGARDMGASSELSTSCPSRADGPQQRVIPFTSPASRDTARGPGRILAVYSAVPPTWKAGQSSAAAPYYPLIPLRREPTTREVGHGYRQLFLELGYNPGPSTTKSAHLLPMPIISISQTVSIESSTYFLTLSKILRQLTIAPNLVSPT